MGSMESIDQDKERIRRTYLEQLQEPVSEITFDFGVQDEF